MANRYRIVLTKRALSDTKKLEKASMRPQAEMLLGVISKNPFEYPPPFKKLSNRDSVYSRRLNIQHRFVYQVLKVEKVIKMISMFDHY